ncbi:MAG: hypothetical protein K8S87_10310 [Planctomycetes bacterium]|nr:hypothetical protein [Planctomycetota bacterium]
MLTKWFGLMVYTQDVAATCEKYRKMTGVEPVEEWEGFFSFNFGGSKLFVVFAPMEGVPFLVFETSEIDNEAERLKNEGFQVGDSFEVRTGKFLFYQDSQNIDYALFQPA